MGEYWNIKIGVEITFMNKIHKLKWFEIIAIVWGFCMSIILGSYILCG